MKFFPDVAVAGEVLNTRQKEASWLSQSHVKHTMSPSISACHKPGTLNSDTGFDRNTPHWSQLWLRLWACKRYSLCGWMGLQKCEWPWELWPGKLCLPALPGDGGRRQDRAPTAPARHGGLPRAAHPPTHPLPPTLRLSAASIIAHYPVSTETC